MYLYVERSPTKVALIVLVCLFGSAASNYFLYKDLMSTGERVTGEVLASVARRDGDVRRKHATTFVWRPIFEGADLFRRDSVRGASVIKFKSGIEMELGEDSLVVIDDALNLDLKYLKGSVIVRTASGDQKISIDKEGKKKVEQLSVRLMEPRLGQTFISAPGRDATVEFRWAARGKGSLQLEVATDRTFSVNRQRVPLPDGQGNALNLGLAPGGYFWRITQEGSPVTDARRFGVIQAPQLTPVWPAQGTTLHVTEAKEPSVFRWTSTGDAAKAQAAGMKLELQISDDSTFAAIRHRQEVQARIGRASVVLEPGSPYFWRLVSRSSDLEVASAASEFSLQVQQKLPISILQPMANSTLSWEPEVRLSWDFDAPSDQYWVRILKDGKAVFDETVNAPAAKWTRPPSGKFRWQVAALKNGKIIGQSPAEEFTILDGQPIALQTPEPSGRFQFWKEPPAVAFTWENHALFRAGYKYQWELAADSKFAKTISTRSRQDTDMTDTNALPGYGLWFWRVRMMDPEGQVVATSRASSFYFGPPPILGPVSDADPPSGTAVQLETVGGAPVVKWDALPDATSYEVTVRDKKKVLLNLNVKETQARLHSLRKGTFWWTVRAIDPLGRKGAPLLTREITLHYGPVLPAPEIVKSKLN